MNNARTAHIFLYLLSVSAIHQIQTAEHPIQDQITGLELFEELKMQYGIAFYPNEHQTKRCHLSLPEQLGVYNGTSFCLFPNKIKISTKKNHARKLAALSRK